jgi:gas vesicle protein
MKDKLTTNASNEAESPAFLVGAVSGSFFRPKNGHELLHAMKNKIRCEIVDTHAFIGAKMLEENLGASFSFKLSEVNKGWTLFKLS